MRNSKPRLKTIKPRLKEMKQQNINIPIVSKRTVVGATRTARRKEMYIKFGGICNICKKVTLFEDYELDHILPLADGGTDTEDNLQLLCISCHKTKTIEENRLR